MEFVRFVDAAGEHRWNLKAKNGQIIATSGEGYKNRSDMVEVINKIKHGVMYAKIVEGDE